MNSFFKTLRKKILTQNRVKQYLTYAIGEILLVVIGILIALQINNSNEARKARLNEQTILKNLVQDLRADSLSFTDNLKTLNEINNLHQALYEIGVKGEELEIENPNAIRLLIYYNPVAMENDPVVASKISNEAIRNEILSYARFLKDLDDTYLEFADLIRDRIRVYLAEKNIHQLSNWFENQSHDTKGVFNADFIDKADLIHLSKSPDFQQLLLEASIKSKNTEFNIERVLSQNQKLKEVIQNELK